LVTQQNDKAAISSSDSDNGEESDNLAEASQAEKDLELINHLAKSIGATPLQERNSVGDLNNSRNIKYSLWMRLYIYLPIFIS